MMKNPGPKRYASARSGGILHHDARRSNSIGKAVVMTVVVPVPVVPEWIDTSSVAQHDAHVPLVIPKLCQGPNDARPGVEAVTDARVYQDDKAWLTLCPSLSGHELQQLWARC